MFETKEEYEARTWTPPKTTDYGIFLPHPINRPVKNNRELVASMKRYGFLPSHPIHCRLATDEPGKLMVVCGHHRLDVAKRLGLPVYYIVDKSDVSIFDLEGSSNQTWTLEQFFNARLSSGDQTCLKIKNLMDKHGMPLGSTIGLATGGVAQTDSRSNNQIKMGTAVFSPNLRFLSAITRVVDELRDAGVSHISRTAYVKALSYVLLVKGLDHVDLANRLVKGSHLLQKPGTYKECMQHIEDAYNYRNTNKQPLKYLAEESARMRKNHLTSGRGRKRRRGGEMMKTLMDG